MQLEKRLDVLEQLGFYFKAQSEELKYAMLKSKIENAWFTIESIEQSLNAIADYFLNREKLTTWLERYPDWKEPESPQTIGLILAGNIPLVGFHDLLCVFVSGHKAQVKTSSKDDFLMKHIIKVLGDMDPECNKRIEVVEQLRNFDAVIATGSSNSNRYFEHYFGKYPNILRNNRSSVAILTGKESEEELQTLGKDVFGYFGLGCRNVSKLYVPKDYDFPFLLDSWQVHSDIQFHNKYKNNFDYQFSLLLLNQTPHYVSKFVMLTERESIVSAISVVHYEVYEKESQWREQLDVNADKIQCAVADPQQFSDLLPFGKAQAPELWDYADGVDVMAFLRDLKQPETI